MPPLVTIAMGVPVFILSEINVSICCRASFVACRDHEKHAAKQWGEAGKHKTSSGACTWGTLAAAKNDTAASDGASSQTRWRETVTMPATAIAAGVMNRQKDIRADVSMFRLTLQNWRGSPRGKFLLGAWAIVFISLSVRAAMKRKAKKRKDVPTASAESAGSPQPKLLGLRDLLRRVLRGRHARKVATYTFILSAAVCARVSASLRLYKQIGVLAGAIGTRNWAAVSSGQVSAGLPPEIYVNICILIRAPNI